MIDTQNPGTIDYEDTVAIDYGTGRTKMACFNQGSQQIELIPLGPESRAIHSIYLRC